jgi:uncharacterized membrane protein YeaQ/YmgE (transglycosylase-associated protein family)
MGIIGFIIVGLIAGLIARAINNGPEPGGIVGTLIVGVVGAIVGGLIASAIGFGDLDGVFDIKTWIIAIVGALIFLWAYGLVVKGSNRSRSHA